MESPSTTPPLNTELQDFPELRRNAAEPKGVLQKNLKMLLYLGAALLVILAAVFSSVGRKAQTVKRHRPRMHHHSPRFRTIRIIMSRT